MNFRKHKVLIIGGGIGMVLLLAALVFLYRSASAYRTQDRAIDRQYRRLAELNARNPFPSVENVEQLEKNLARLDQHNHALADTLGRDPFPPDVIEAAGFSAMAQSVIERFRRRADEAGIRLPEMLEAGFAQYASGGVVPAAQHVPRLSRQLYSVERVADVLVDCGVTSIDMLTREDFEKPKTEAPSRRRRGAEPLPVVEEGSRAQASVVGPDDLYYAERVGVEFVATEVETWLVLERLASVPHFMVVTEFSQITQTDILSHNPDEFGKAEDAELKSFLESGVLTGDQAILRDERIVAGNEMLKVSLSVLVYNFRPLEEPSIQ